jgi:hypothetical protein
MTMMAMDNLVRRVEALRSMCFDQIESKEIREISVELPDLPLDELYFRKTIAWCYVLFNETGPFFMFTGKLLRSNPPANEVFGSVKRLVDCARTAHAHNLLVERPSDLEKKRTYEIWMLQNGGSPTDWKLCCEALMRDVDRVLDLIQVSYSQRCENEADRLDLWKNYLLERQTHWEAHEFDSFVEAGALAANIGELNFALFRKEGNRVEKWRKLAVMFETREAAEKALARAIQAEMINLFGLGRPVE